MAADKSMTSAPVNLRCTSCGRTIGTGPNGVETVSFLGIAWCTRCARVAESLDGSDLVLQPSPGRMTDSETINELDAWIDCFEMKPKRRIKRADARDEIQRAWAMWKGDKSSDQSMLLFFGWLRRFRPYFLTFRETGDAWQTVHSWLIRYEDCK